MKWEYLKLFTKGNKVDEMFFSADRGTRNRNRDGSQEMAVLGELGEQGWNLVDTGTSLSGDARVLYLKRRKD